MFRRVLLSTLGIAAAVGGPIAYFSLSDQWKALRRAMAAPDAKIASSETALAPQLPPLPTTPPEIALEGSPVRDLAEVLRFDVTPEWVMRRWPRVSAGLAQLELQGYRVPLVTGTAQWDLAGSLTYYFNPKQQVQRITFYGSTGDMRKLAGLLTARYRFVRRLTNDPSLFVYEAADSGGRRSVAQFRAAHLIRSADAYRRFDVQLLMERPEG